MTWKAKLAGLSRDEIIAGVEKATSEGWPPSVGEFIKMAQDGDLDFDDAFERMIKRKPHGKVEVWASREVGSRCRKELPQDKARALHRRTLEKFFKREREGLLNDPNVALLSQPKDEKRGSFSWEGPNGKWYTCPSQYWAEKMNEDKNNA